MIKAAIFDLNGIFIKSPKLSERFEKDFNISKEDFLKELLRIMDAVRKPGAEGAFSYWKNVFGKWNISFSEKEFWDYWFKAETADEDMIDLAKRLKEKGIKVILLSNNFKERAEYYDNYPWMKTVIDKAYFSWQTGLTKPDVRAWQLILEDFNLLPSECIYFDDQEKNTQAAESLGIKSYLFKDADETEKIISSSE